MHSALSIILVFLIDDFIQAISGKNSRHERNSFCQLCLAYVTGNVYFLKERDIFSIFLQSFISKFGKRGKRSYGQVPVFSETSSTGKHVSRDAKMYDIRNPLVSD